MRTCHRHERSTETVCVCVDVCEEETRVGSSQRGGSVCVCVYVKDTSRSTETGSVCVCERHV